MCTNYQEKSPLTEDCFISIIVLKTVKLIYTPLPIINFFKVLLKLLIKNYWLIQGAANFYKDIQEKYQHEIKQKINEIREKEQQPSWNEIINITREAAVKHIGFEKITKKVQVVDEKVERLSKDQLKLRLEIENEKWLSEKVGNWM